MPLQCRSTAYDAGLATKQHQANVSCLLSNSPHDINLNTQIHTEESRVITQSRFNVGPPSATVDQHLTITVPGTLVPRATLRGVVELHVASGMPQWRMFVTCCYF